MGKYIIAAMLFAGMFTLLTLSVLQIAHDGNYTKNRKVGEVNSGELVNVIEVEDEIAVVSINNRSTIMREGDKFILDEERSEYKGSIKLVKLDNESATFEFSLEKTKRYNINIVVVGLVSLIASLILLQILGVSSVSRNA